MVDRLRASWESLQISRETSFAFNRRWIFNVSANWMISCTAFGGSDGWSGMQRFCGNLPGPNTGVFTPRGTYGLEKKSKLFERFGKNLRITPDTKPFRELPDQKTYQERGKAGIRLPLGNGRQLAFIF
jgi:hypothetical protein